MNLFDKKATGANIRKIREFYSLSEDQFAEQLKVKVAQLRQWEQGKNLPNAKILERILNFKPTLNAKQRSKLVKKVKDGKQPKELHMRLISDEDINRIVKEKSVEQFDMVFLALTSLSLQALSDMGWGKTRLNRFLTEQVKLLKSAEQDSNRITDIQNRLYRKYGIKVYYDMEKGCICRKGDE